MFLFEYEKDNARKIRTDPQASREEALNATLLVQFSGVISYEHQFLTCKALIVIPHATCYYM